MIKYLKKIGLDKSIIFTIAGKSINILGSVSVIFLISRYLTEQEQGFYYTFGSIIALQVFFELGLSYVIIHYASYETAWLTWTQFNTLTGDEKAKSRLASLLHFTFKWYLVVSIGLLVLLLPVGYFFFSNTRQNIAGVNWGGPWVLMCFSTSFFLLITPIFSFLEGCGKVKEVALYHVYQNILNYIVIGSALFFGLHLYALGLGVLVSSLAGLLWLNIGANRRFLKDLWFAKGQEYIINWRKEILPFQWKIAVSWLSGYLIFQLFNPVLFHFQGPEVAGKMGMSLTAFTGVSVISMAWLNTKIPVFSVLIAKKDFARLDSIFNKAAGQSFLVILAASFTLVGFIYMLQANEFAIGNRFLPVKLAVLLALINVINQVIFAQAIYLRAHKQEPFLLNSIVGSILTGTGTYISGRYFGVEAVVLVYFLLNLVVGLPWSSYVFFTKRKLWHTSQAIT